MARIKRDGKGVRRAVKANSRAKTARRAKVKTNSFFDGIVAVLPFTDEQIQKFFLVLILTLLAAGAWFLASLAGVPAVLQAQFASATAEAGFEVRYVEVSGINRMDDQKVYDAVWKERNAATPMMLLDLEEIRERLLALSWVKDARVSRQLPQTLAIDIVERTPHAALQKPDRLVLIDAEGVPLEPISKEKAKEMLTISGPGASRVVGNLDRLLDAAPALQPHVNQAELVGNRRWNITFNTGQVLALPEGEDEAAKALVDFARLDGQNRLLGGKVATFDMRAPPKIYLRIPGRSDRLLQSEDDE